MRNKGKFIHDPCEPPEVKEEALSGAADADVEVSLGDDVDDEEEEHLGGTDGPVVVGHAAMMLHQAILDLPPRLVPRSLAPAASALADVRVDPGSGMDGEEDQAQEGPIRAFVATSTGVQAEADGSGPSATKGSRGSKKPPAARVSFTSPPSAGAATCGSAPAAPEQSSFAAFEPGGGAAAHGGVGATAGDNVPHLALPAASASMASCGNADGRLHPAAGSSLRQAQDPAAAVSAVASGNGPAGGRLLGEGGAGDNDDVEAEVDSAEQPQVSGASNTVPSAEASTAQLRLSQGAHRGGATRGGGPAGDEQRGGAAPRRSARSTGTMQSKHHA